MADYGRPAGSSPGLAIAGKSSRAQPRWRTIVYSRFGTRTPASFVTSRASPPRTGAGSRGAAVGRKRPPVHVERELVARRPSGPLDPLVDGAEGVRERPAARPAQLRCQLSLAERAQVGMAHRVRAELHALVQLAGRRRVEQASRLALDKWMLSAAEQPGPT